MSKNLEWTTNQIKRKTILSFLIFTSLLILSIIGFKYMVNRPLNNGAIPLLRKGLFLNEKINRPFFNKTHLVEIYPKNEAVKRPRVNGNIGAPTVMPDTSKWRLIIINSFNKKMNKDSIIKITLMDIMKLPKIQFTYEFKCIEGWSQKTWWGGVRLSTFLNFYHLGTDNGSDPEAGRKHTAIYIGLKSIDEKYYVGIDMLSALHPQTILCYEMNGKPLPLNQGAPLRLIIPIKYGIKSIKWIGTIFFSNTRPSDYWFERGYDYDAAL